MTLKDELMELADKVEKATGPDRELDAEIARAVGLELQVVRIGPDYRRERLSWIDRNSGAAPTSRPVPSYTASLDAAMTLAPEGEWWAVDGVPGTEFVACINNDVDKTTFGKAATPALALTAAALRARASIKGSSHVGG